jgi:hypothetical protein
MLYNIIFRRLTMSPSFLELEKAMRTVAQYHAENRDYDRAKECLEDAKRFKQLGEGQADTSTQNDNRPVRERTLRPTVSEKEVLDGLGGL